MSQGKYRYFFNADESSAIIIALRMSLYSICMTKDVKRDGKDYLTVLNLKQILIGFAMQMHTYAWKKQLCQLVSRVLLFMHHLLFMCL